MKPVPERYCWTAVSSRCEKTPERWRLKALRAAAWTAATNLPRLLPVARHHRCYWGSGTRR
ncbi:hypothetical protein GCM10011408_40950 [Dyella caseinilytica]|nr:hypothetical protein GCM10011408_40950 [Dyella caseinilytica]